MKKYISLVLVLIVYSCKNDLVKDVDKIDGTWHLKEMTYYNEDSLVDSRIEAPSLLTFGKRKGNGYESIPVTQIVKSDTFNFTCLIGGNQTINMQMPGVVRDRLPVTGIGRVQSYHYRFVNKNTIEFTIDKEFDNQHDELYSNLTYRYQRE